MNSSYGRGKKGSIDAFDFDFGLGGSRSQSMNDLKNQSSSATTNAYNMSGSTWNHQSSKPSWQQPAASVQPGMKSSLSGPTSMVGDIFGKTWNSSTPTSTGVVDNKNANLFGDLLSSAMGLNRSSNTVPLKNAALPAGVNSFGTGSLADLLPKSSYAVKNSRNGGSNSGVGDADVNVNPVATNIRHSSVSSGGKSSSNQTLGGPSMRNMTGNEVKNDFSGDPFASFADFGAKIPSTWTNKDSEKKDHASNTFREFQFSAPKAGLASSAGVYPASFSNGSGVSASPGNQSQSSQQTWVPNDFDSLFSSTPSSGAAGMGEFSSQPISDDWGTKPDFLGGNDTNAGIDFEGDPPPPAGVSASTAKSKGMDDYKQGQFGDAIKWLSWASILLEKAGDVSGLTEVLKSRASCYKEVGEYKKAVADCSKVLEQDSKNVSVLVQRALLYESMEKYKLGAEDLRTVMKLDPGNPIARSTIHRLTKLAG